MNNKKNKWAGYRGRIVAATPMICLIVYLTIGFVWNIWSPTWAIFFLIPLMPFIVGTKSITQLITYPILCVAIYLVLGFVFGWWHPGWLVFLTIPVYYTLIPRHKKDEKIIEFSE